jgi:predicted 2-oxoglutarate/Fe(II)-dependent dioxygenase YbiX
MFDDELENNLQMGDLIIYSGETNHKYLPVTSGTQYIIVGLINIYE